MWLSTLHPRTGCELIIECGCFVICLKEGNYSIGWNMLPWVKCLFVPRLLGKLCFLYDTIVCFLQENLDLLKCVFFKRILIYWGVFSSGASAQLAIGGLTTVLENFKLSSNKSHPKKVFPPPSLPRDFRPYHVSSSSPGVNSLATPPLRRVLDANVRGLMLGETPIIRSTGESRWSGLFLYKDWFSGFHQFKVVLYYI